MGRFRKGAASFYIVAFSTLVLVIIAASFAITVVSEMVRTSNDDLSQSAYDAALAGVEDAKVAYMNYKSCIDRGYTAPTSLSDGDSVTCGDIIYWMNHPDCDMVAHILGRIGKRDSGEVMISETTSGNNNMNQAYTCTKINTTLSDYRANLSASNVYKVVKVDFASGVSADSINWIRLSWFSDREGEIYNYNNILNVAGDWRVTFQPLKVTKAATPPTLAIKLIQTAQNFSVEQMLSPTTGSGATDRATVFLVPTREKTAAVKSNTSNTNAGAYDNDKEENKLSAVQVARTNNLSKNVPYVVYCPENSGSEFMCSVELGLPKPIGGERNNSTFMFVVYLPYGKPDTDFAIEFCNSEGACSTNSSTAGSSVASGSAAASLSGMQVVIDSTGRANDLYRRVEVRMESTDSSFAYAIDALELTKNSSGGGDPELKKEMTVTSEYSNSEYTDLPEFPNVQNKTYSVKAYPKVDGVEYPGGYGDFRFDVYVDGTPVKSNVRTWSMNVKERSVIRIEAKSVTGYKVVNSVISKVIDKNTVITPEWTLASYPVEIATKIGDDVYERGYEGFTYNIWLNNRLVADGVEYYYNGSVKYGTKLVVEPITRSGNCSASRINRTITEALSLNVAWSGSCLPELNVIPVIDGKTGPRDGFTFSVYTDNGATLVAGNVTSFSQRLAAGSDVRIVVNSVAGYTIANNTIEIHQLKDDQSVQVKWNTKKYMVDVNVVVNGEVYEHGLSGYEFDLYFNGEKVRSRIIDFYEEVAYGTRVEVKPYGVEDYVTSDVEGVVGAGALVLNPTWRRGKYYVDVNVVANGVTYPHGVYGLTFDVYVNDSLVANDWTDFYQQIDYDSKVRVVANKKSGFKLINGDKTQYVKGVTTFSPTWVATDGTSIYDIDVNTVVDGVEYDKGLSGFTFSVYVAGTKVATNVTDLSAGVVGGSNVRVVANGKSGYTLTNGDEVRNVTSNTVFRPTWTKNITTINYYGNGGSGNVASQTVVGGESVALRGNAFAREGYTFTGWNTEANGSGTSYSAGSIFVAPEVVNNTMNLYAQWRENPKITIAYNANGGTGSMASHSTKSGIAITIKANGFVRDGYTFTGWNTKANGSGTSFSAGQNWTPIYDTSQNITLYAQWEKNAVVTIVYDANGGTGTVASQTVNSGTAITLRANGFSRSGFSFAGWNTKADGTGTNYTAGQSWTPNYSTSTEVRLYANWNYQGTYIQDLTLDDCRTRASSSAIEVADRRDNRVYKVRYTNGSCWMISNLMLAGGTTVTSALSNVTTNYTLPASHAQNKSCRSQTRGCVFNGKDYDGNSTMYYNYCAATAGTICSDDIFDYAGSDICPKGWRLPTSGEVSGLTYVAFRPVNALNCDFNGNSNAEGCVSNNNAGNAGFWWTTTYYATSTYGARQRLLEYSGGLSITAFWNERNYEHFVRCKMK